MHCVVMFSAFHLRTGFNNWRLRLGVILGRRDASEEIGNQSCPQYIIRKKRIRIGFDAPQQGGWKLESDLHYRLHDSCRWVGGHLLKHRCYGACGASTSKMANVGIGRTSKIGPEIRP